jgi:uracil-DNA glycosylase family 4
MLVPNVFPKYPDPKGRRLAIVGEAPGADEEITGEPFVGASGRLLRLVLSHAGIAPEACFIGNICQQRPPDNDITAFAWDGPELDEGKLQLVRDLDKFNPNAVLSLGRTAFRFFNPDKCFPCRPTKDNPDGIKIPLQDWRGSVFTFGDWKIVPTFHPAYILRVFSDIAYFRADLARAVKHSSSRLLSPVVRTGILRPSLAEVTSFLGRLVRDRIPTAFDIEGYSDAIGVTMLSICDSPTSGLVIPFYIDGANYWSEDEEIVVWSEVARWLADPKCPKAAHNAFYETAVLGWRHRCVIDGLVDDTMMKHWEVFNELEKSLGVATSLWIEEPYYKDERTSSNTNVKLLYNFKDSACTYEINTAIEPTLAKIPRAYEHYRFNVSLIPPYTYMHLRGCRFDKVRAAEHKAKAEQELAVLNEQIEAEVGREFNVKSTLDKQWLLYEHLGFEPYKRYGTSTKEEILLRYYAKTKNKTLLKVVQAINKRTRISDIEKLTCNVDGRIRTSYDLVGTVTGRLASRDSSITELGITAKGKEFHEEFGTNLQNVTKALRDCFVPDSEEFTFFQCDLSGADAWTVAADLAALGNSTMLDDLRAGVKPSKVLLCMLEAIERGEDPSVIARASSDDLKRRTSALVISEDMLPDGRPGNWLYTCMKRVQHGTNYGAKPEIISATIFKDSDGVIDVPVLQIERYQRLYKLRYNTDLRAVWVRDQLAKQGYLDTAAGCRRRYFAIRNPRMLQLDDDVVKAALASEPQTNTTYATNLALSKLWYDTANRRKTGALFIEPLLQIHDALAGQFPTRLASFAAERLQTYFNNELIIHGLPIVIPADAQCGRNWYDCKHPLV